jgi:hypothetical protein
MLHMLAVRKQRTVDTSVLLLNVLAVVFSKALPVKLTASVVLQRLMPMSVHNAYVPTSSTSTAHGSRS